MDREIHYPVTTRSLIDACSVAKGVYPCKCCVAHRLGVHEAQMSFKATPAQQVWPTSVKLTGVGCSPPSIRPRGRRGGGISSGTTPSSRKPHHTPLRIRHRAVSS